MGSIGSNQGIDPVRDVIVTSSKGINPFRAWDRLGPRAIDWVREGIDRVRRWNRSLPGMGSIGSGERSIGSGKESMGSGDGIDPFRAWDRLGPPSDRLGPGRNRLGEAM